MSQSAALLTRCEPGSQGLYKAIRSVATGTTFIKHLKGFSLNPRHQIVRRRRFSTCVETPLATPRHCTLIFVIQIKDTLLWT